MQCKTGKMIEDVCEKILQQEREREKNRIENMKKFNCVGIQNCVMIDTVDREKKQP